MAYRADDRLELALRASNEGIWDWNVATGKIHYSGRILRFLGCRRDEVPHLFEDLSWIHDDDRGEFRAKLEAAMAPGGVQRLAVEPRGRGPKGGDWRYFRIRGIVVRDEAGEPVRLAGSMIDISRRKRAEEALKEERHLMRLLIDNVPLNIYFKDRESRFTLVNASMVKWIGKSSADEMLGKTDHDIFEAEHADQARRDELKIMETGKPIVGYLELETSSEGEDVWVLTTKMPLPDRKGKIIGTFGVSSDVSELVNTQRSLAALAAKLKERNNEIEEELVLAREVQQALLPQEYPTLPAGALPGESRVSFGYRYIPISGLAGDFFEVIPAGENAVAMLICDVMGHGVRSAIIVSMLRGLLEQVEESAKDPASFLTELNEGLSRILRQAGVTMFATAFVTVVDLETNELRYASAGHPAGIVRSSDGASILPLGGRGAGPGLGLFAEAEYETQCMKLDGIRQVLMFTDGIFEIENRAGEALLQNRLVRVVRDADSENLEDLLGEVLDRVLAFADSKQFDDDVCLLGMDLTHR